MSAARRKGLPHSARAWTWLMLLLITACSEPVALRVGSKKFTESVVLGEVTRGLLESEGFAVVHRKQLGGTRVLWEGLETGEIDIYVEYTGTLREEIFAGRELQSAAELRSALAAKGISASEPLGFNNTYAIGMRESEAAARGIVAISDLAQHADLVFGMGNEFLDRGDGWPSLATRYGLGEFQVQGLDHDLAYRALESGEIHVMDLYSTDAEIAHYGLRVLHDDREHFPVYEALILWRAELDNEVESCLRRLQGSIDAERMVAMNAAVKLGGEGEATVAARFLLDELQVRIVANESGLPARLWRRTLEHLFLVLISMTAAIAVGVPTGILASLRPGLGRGLLAVIGVLQTIPSLVMFVLFMPLLGIGADAAIAALFLYSLLPIVRGTHTGLESVPRELKDSAAALGLERSARMRLVELPLAMRSILSGIQVAAVINVGTATLGALIGAGGYGQPILTGIRLADAARIAEGAVPAALLAIAAHLCFEGLGRLLVSRGLRLDGRGL